MNAAPKAKSDACQTLAAALRIPKGFRLRAQGCEERAALGVPEKDAFNPNGVVAESRQHIGSDSPQPKVESGFYPAKSGYPAIEI